MTKLRIFLADDHAVVREGLKALVNAQPDMEVIGEAADGRTAWEQAKACQPDIVVMDLSMPQLNGAQATERLKQACPQVKVLALTVHEDKGYVHQLLQAGASGYVLKLAATEELIHAIRIVAAGGVYLDPSVARTIVANYMHKPSLGEAVQRSQLSERETEVLCLIAKGYTNKEIAAQLDLSVKTVETYKTRLLKKLDLRSRADIVRYALRQGWLDETTAP
jgi:DNA-binding NarL/FixJ family response regulator